MFAKLHHPKVLTKQRTSTPCQGYENLKFCAKSAKKRLSTFEQDTGIIEEPTKDSDVVDEIIDSLLGGELAGVLPSVCPNDSLDKKQF